MSILTDQQQSPHRELHSSGRSVFLSYSRSDRRRVTALASLLETFGHSVFVDHLSIKPGMRWRERINTALDEADVFLVFWTKFAARSSEVQKECDYFLNHHQDRPVVPILGDTCPLTEALQARQFLDFCPLVNEVLELVRDLRTRGVSTKEIQAAVIKHLEEAGVELDLRQQKRFFLLFGAAGAVVAPATLAFDRAADAVLQLTTPQVVTLGVTAAGGALIYGTMAPDPDLQTSLGIDALQSISFENAWLDTSDPTNIKIWGSRAESAKYDPTDYLVMGLAFAPEKGHFEVSARAIADLGIVLGSGPVFFLKDADQPIVLKSGNITYDQEAQVYPLDVSDRLTLTTDLAQGQILSFITRSQDDDMKLAVKNPAGKIVTSGTVARGVRHFWSPIHVYESGRYTFEMAPLSKKETRVGLEFINANGKKTMTVRHGDRIEVSIREHHYDYAKYQLKLEQGELLRLAPPWNAVLRLYDENGTRTTGGGSGGGEILFLCERTGTYYLVVYHDTYSKQDYASEIRISRPTRE